MATDKFRCPNANLDDSSGRVPAVFTEEPTMIKRLYADNYRCFVNFEMQLEELSLLLGRNGAGKTSVLDIVFALRELLSGRTPITGSSAFPPATLTRWQSRRVQVFEMDVALKGNAYSYRLEVEHDKAKRAARINLEQLRMNGDTIFEFNAGEVHLYRDDLSAGPVFPSDWTVSSLARVVPRPENSYLTAFQDFIRRILVCSPHPKNFSTEASTEDEILARDGRNFASWYRHMSQERPDLLDSLREDMRSVLDGFHGIRMEKVGTDTRALKMVFAEGNEEYRFDEVSDGQRALTALHAVKSLTKSLTADQVTTIFWDEPDNYVALREIQPWLMNMVDLCGESQHQAVLCSHHPELIDYLGGDRGILLRREVSGATTADRLARVLKDNASAGGLKLSELLARGWDS